MRVFLVILAALMIGKSDATAQNDPAPVRTNFISGATLSSSELEAVIKLSNLRGIQTVAQVSTEIHLSGKTIKVSGDEKFEGRSVTFKTLRIHRNGWDRQVRPDNAPSVGEFWVEFVKPQQEEQTIVQIGGRKVRVYLTGGIKPAGADKIIKAFVKGRVRPSAGIPKDNVFGEDLTQLSWIHSSGGELWISFGKPLTLFKFKLDGDEVKFLNKVEMYE